MGRVKRERTQRAKRQAKALLVAIRRADYRDLEHAALSGVLATLAMTDARARARAVRPAELAEAQAEAGPSGEEVDQ